MGVLCVLQARGVKHLRSFPYFLFGLLWARMVFSYANGVGVLGEVVGIELSNAALQFEDAGVTGADECVFVGDELILDRELVTERLNEVVFGF